MARLKYIKGAFLIAQRIKALEPLWYIPSMIEGYSGGWLYYMRGGKARPMGWYPQRIINLAGVKTR